LACARSIPSAIELSVGRISLAIEHVLSVGVMR
jgi:hypothetical protein